MDFRRFLKLRVFSEGKVARWAEGARLAPILILILVPLALHLPELGGWLTTNPIYYGTDLVGPGITMGSGKSPLPGYPWLDPNVGSTTWSLGTLAARFWSRGIVPWWNPYVGVGLPLAAEGQTPALFLPFVLLFKFDDGLLYLKISLQALSGIFSLIFLRQIIALPRVALIGALLFELNGTFAVMSDQPIMPVAFLPLLLFGIERARLHSEQSLPGGWRWIAAAIALSLYAGFPETAYLNGILAAMWCLARIATLRRAAAWRFLARIAMGLCAGVLLGAPILMPFLELVARSDIRDPASLLHAIGPYNSFSLMLPATTIPYIFGPPAYRDAFLLHGAWSGYVTMPALMVAMFGLLTRGRVAIRVGLSAFALLAVARMAGAPGVSDAVDLLPFMRQLLVARYIWPALELGAMLSICLFLDSAPDRWESRGLRRLLPVAAATVVAGFGLWKAAPMLVQEYRVGHTYAWFVVLSVGWAFVSCVMVTMLVYSGHANRRVAIAALLIADAALFSALPVLSAIHPRPLDVSGIQFLRDHLGYDRYVTLGPLPANYGAGYELASVNFNTEPTPKLWLEGGGNRIVWNLQNQAVDAAKARWLESYGTKYVVVAANSTVPVATGSGGAAPKVFASATMNIYELPSPAPYLESADGGCTIDILARDKARIICGKPSTLIRRELFYPGWEAQVNGQTAQLQACGIYQCLPLPPGSARIRFSFVPSHIYLAVAGCLAGIVIVAAGAIYRLAFIMTVASKNPARGAVLTPAS